MAGNMDYHPAVVAFILWFPQGGWTKNMFSQRAGKNGDPTILEFPRWRWFKQSAPKKSIP